MTDFRQIEHQFQEALHLARRPVGIALSQTVPDGVPKFEGVVPSGCTFWRLAAEGRVFYTVPGDHYNCAIGCYTHNIPLPSDREGELMQTLGLMTEIGYLRMEEVPGIPQLPSSPAAVIYAPLGEVPVDPDVVILSGPADAVMLLQEAAIRAGVAANLNTLGRPTCMAVPAALKLGLVASTGCIGNRVYTEIGVGELYAVVPGTALNRLAEEVSTISGANAKLLAYHTARRQQLLVV